MVDLTRRGFLARLREAVREPARVQPMRSENSSNLPAPSIVRNRPDPIQSGLPDLVMPGPPAVVMPEELRTLPTAPAAVTPEELRTLPDMLNPSQSRRGFLSMLGNAAARQALRGPAGRLAERLAGGDAGEVERLHRAIDSYLRDAGRVANIPRSSGDDVSSERALVHQLLNRLHGGNWNSDVLNANVDSVIDEFVTPWRMGKLDADAVRAELSRRSGLPHETVTKHLGNHPADVILHQDTYADMRGDPLEDTLLDFMSRAEVNDVSATPENYVRHVLLPEGSGLDPRRLLRSQDRHFPETAGSIQGTLESFIEETADDPGAYRYTPGPVDPQATGALRRVAVGHGDDTVGHYISPRNPNVITPFDAEGARRLEREWYARSRVGMPDDPPGTVGHNPDYSVGEPMTDAEARSVGEPMTDAEARSVEAQMRESFTQGRLPRGGR